MEGVMVLQRGEEIARHRWIPEERRNIRSVSKSFTSIAIGMAIDEGKLKLSDKVNAAFPSDNAPDYQLGKSADPEQTARWDSLTLYHLLTMTMGQSRLSRPMTVQEALSYNLSRVPGSVFSYDNTAAFLASAMLTKATGLSLRDYLVERLFQPLGITNPEWKESADGFTNGASDLLLSTSEMALFGQFLLQRGNWKGKQLVSTAWMEAATRTQVPTRRWKGSSDYGMGYGYYFWICPHGAFRCEGVDGQYIVVIPCLDAVVAINSQEENFIGILQTVWNFILPAL